MGEVDINTLTMEQYMALTRGNQAPDVVKPEIGGNVNLEIKSQFMRELREDASSGNKNDNTHEHVERVLDIVSFFNILGVTHDAVMLRVLPITLTGAAKRYCPPSKTVKRLKEICNFKQKGGEPLYQAWERYNDLLYKCPTHDNNSHQKVNIFYNCLGTMNRQLLDSQGPIPGMTPAQALTSIQTMVDHSQKWHDDSPSRSVCSSSNTEGIAAIVAQEDNILSGVLPCQLPPKELNPGSFTLPCTIRSLIFYYVADLGAIVNVIPKSMFEHLKLTNLKKTNMLVEMADMTKRALIGIVENILVKINKFLFPSDFIVIDMLNTRNETMILGRPFLATIHAEIGIFNREISLGIRDDRVTFDMDKKNHDFTSPI
ncbi:hypothetical protein Tco_1373145 [Tanacetum coccineum]